MTRRRIINKLWSLGIKEGDSLKCAYNDEKLPSSLGWKWEDIHHDHIFKEDWVININYSTIYIYSSDGDRTGSINRAWCSKI